MDITQFIFLVSGCDVRGGLRRQKMTGSRLAHISVEGLMKIGLNDASARHVLLRIDELLGRKSHLGLREKTDRLLEKGYGFYNGLEYLHIKRKRGLSLINEAADLGNTSARAFLLQHKTTDSPDAEDKGHLLFSSAVIAANLNEPIGMTVLGDCYKGGIGVKVDLKEALYWFQRGADAGSAVAKFKLALAHYKGEGVQRSKKAALKLFFESGSTGYSAAMNFWGFLTVSQSQNPKEIRTGFEWIRKSASQGHKGGQYNLASCYRNGLGVEKNKAIAMDWFLKAAKQKDDNDREEDYSSRSIMEDCEKLRFRLEAAKLLF
uniref:Uncharacterized protein n=1 Tax=Lotharella globosa TaxID=91324 RepID=A0A6V3P7W0_9EUKA|mmetsp:Transcript_12044/g.24212  ORF Transcript_12044/g.24212 Transcript_12044/m.24212 type:complete len:319 (+) Transcript_12044:144-1100(+)